MNEKRDPLYLPQKAPEVLPDNSCPISRYNGTGLAFVLNVEYRGTVSIFHVHDAAFLARWLQCHGGLSVSFGPRSAYVN